MPLIKMSDGRGFTDYRPQTEQVNDVSIKYNSYDSKSIRQSFVTNATDIMKTKECTPKQATGMNILCNIHTT